MRIGLMTTLWQRPRLSEIVLRYYTDLDLSHLDIELECMAAVSTVEDEKIARACGWHCVMVDNEPLGRKHNAAMYALRQFDVEGAIIIGSDDLLGGTYWNQLKRCLHMGNELVEVHGIYVYDLQRDRLRYGRGIPTGAGRFLTRHLLDREEWMPWHDERTVRLDGSVEQKLGGVANPKRTFGDAQRFGIIVLDIKAGGTQMWSPDAIENHTASHKWRTIDDPGAWLDFNFPGITGQLATIPEPITA